MNMLMSWKGILNARLNVIYHRHLQNFNTSLFKIEGLISRSAISDLFCWNLSKGQNLR